MADTTRAWLVAATLMVGLGTAACASPNSSSTPTATASVGLASRTSSPSLADSTVGAAVVPSSAAGSGAEQQATVDAALQDAAAYLGISPNSLTVQQVEPRQWGDASLGCPQADVMYSQVVTPGFLIVIAGGSQTLEYHADNRQRVVLCHVR